MSRLRSIPVSVLLVLGLLAPGGCTSLAPADPAPRSSDPREADPWFASGREAVAAARDHVALPRRARNVILFVGDGMGIATVTAARILEGQRRGEPGEENRLAFERLPFVALSKTYSTDAQVSDSAATITALVSGVKTKSGVIGVSDRVRLGDPASVADARVPSLFEEAEARGLATGVVSTATITHATPAGAYAHVPMRHWEDDARLSDSARRAGFPDIARQLVEWPAGDGLEVALGGGRSHFLPASSADPEYDGVAGARLDGRDLTAEWTAAGPGAAYVWSRDQLAAVDRATTRRLLGLFEPSHMKWEADREADAAGEPSLAELTAAAIEVLARDPEGYVLMVEAGRIDHGHHAGNAYRALGDTIALSDAVRTALERTSADDTLIVVTADHSHTLTISGYPRRGNPILGKVVPRGLFNPGEYDLAVDALGRPYTTLSYANGPGYTGASGESPEGPHGFGHRPCSRTGGCSYEGIRTGRPDLSEVDTESPAYLQEATVPMGSETHAGEDVPIYAGGPGAALFHGVQEQHYVYHAMAEALGWTERGRPVD